MYTKQLKSSPHLGHSINIPNKISLNSKEKYQQVRISTLRVTESGFLDLPLHFVHPFYD